MEEPFFCQDDHLLCAAIENDLRAAHESQQQQISTSTVGEQQRPADNDGDTNGSKTMMQAVGEILAQSAHIVKDAVLNKHTSNSRSSSGETLASSAREEETETGTGTGTAAASVDADAPRAGASEWSVMQAVGDIVSHPVQSMKDLISGHYNHESDQRSEEECTTTTTGSEYNTVSSVLEESIEDHRPRDEGLAYIVKEEKDALSNGGVGETLGAREEESEEGADASEWSVVHVVGEIISHPVQSMKDIITGHYNHESVHRSEEECNTTGSHNTVASVLDDSMENHRLRGGMENGDRAGDEEEAGEPQKKTMMETVSELISHSMETVKESVKEAVLHNGNLDHENMEDVRSAILKQEAEGVEAASERQHEGGEEDKDLLQTVKEAAQSVKEAVLSNGTMAHVSGTIIPVLFYLFQDVDHRVSSRHGKRLPTDRLVI